MRRTQLINALRAHLAELGIVAAQGREGIQELLKIVADNKDQRIPIDARASLMLLAAQLQAVQTVIGLIEKRIMAQHRSNEASKRLETIPGIGVIGATAIAATVADPSVFRSGRDFAAWIGLVPRQDSTGGKQKLGPISKQGDQISETHSRRWGACCVATCQAEPREVPLDNPAPGAAPVQGRRGGARQQDGARRLGPVGQGWQISPACNRGRRLRGSAMKR